MCARAWSEVYIRCMVHAWAMVLCGGLLCRYEQLVTLYPDNQEYKLYHSQSLYKVCCGMCRTHHTARLLFAMLACNQHSMLSRLACWRTSCNTSPGESCCHVSISAWGPHVHTQAGMYVEANKAAVKVEGHQKAVTMLLVANAYEQDDLVGASSTGADWAQQLHKLIFSRKEHQCAMIAAANMGTTGAGLVEHVSLRIIKDQDSQYITCHVSSRTAFHAPHVL